ncbi:MAG: GGDEF domain-containing protein [Candidatus Izemoplasma sp.]|nr:GGDEF domain-containing protein [Candidatus Izemoplasma sp.]
MHNQFEREELISFLNFKYLQANKELSSTSKRLFRLKRVIDLLNDQSLDDITVKELIGMSEETLFTGAYGRGQFIEEAETRFNKAKANKLPFSVIDIDLDRFKKVNDNYGYDVGDIVIKRTQDEIISILQAFDASSIIERRGGDEFTIVVNLNPKKASQLVTKILNSIVAVDYSDVADDLCVGATAGIAGITGSTKIYQDVLHDATIALYQNKKNNR